KTILAIVAQHADAATWNKLHAEAQAEKSPMIKDRLYGLLAIAKDKALAQRALDLALTAEPGATNSAGMIRGVSWRHPEMAYDFAMAHRAQVDKLVDSTSGGRYYPSLGSSSFDPAMIDNIQYRQMVRKDRLPAVDAWLAKNGG